MPIQKALAFTVEEYRTRLDNMRKTMAERDLDGLILHTPENICYASGYHTPGYYFTQVLLVSDDKDPVLVTRRLELGNAHAFSWLAEDGKVGYLDTENPVDVIARQMADLGLDKGRIGAEMSGYSFISIARFDELRSRLAGATFVDGSGVVEEHRAVKSPAELDTIRRSCRISDLGMEAAREHCRAGMTENELAGWIHKVMVEAGGEYPGLPLFISAGHRTLISHATWTDKVIEKGENVLVEHTGVVNRYAGPLFRTFSVGEPSSEFADRAAICRDMVDAVIEAIRPGATSDEVNAAAVKAGRGMGTRKRAGYSVGLNFPPDWGEGVFLDLKEGDETEIKAGMVFHVPETIRVDDKPPVALSETVLVTESGREVLTKFQPPGLVVV